MAQVTQADLIRVCEDFKQHHGIIALLSILEDIIECQAQSAGVVLLDEDSLDEMETAYFTVQ